MRALADASDKSLILRDCRRPRVCLRDCTPVSFIRTTAIIIIIIIIIRRGGFSACSRDRAESSRIRTIAPIDANFEIARLRCIAASFLMHVCKINMSFALVRCVVIVCFFVLLIIHDKSRALHGFATSAPLEHDKSRFTPFGRRGVI